MKAKLIGVWVGTVLSFNLAIAQEPLTTPPREIPRLSQPGASTGGTVYGQPVDTTGPMVEAVPQSFEPTAFNSSWPAMGGLLPYSGGSMYGGVEGLLWWFRDGRTPPLLSSGTQGSLGVLDRPGAVVVLGNDKIDAGARWGGRFTLGRWCDDGHGLAVEATYIVFEDRTTEDGLSSTGSPLLTRPIFDALFGRESGEPLAFPGELAGGLAYQSSSSFHGGEINCVTPILNGFKSCIQFVSGVRYLNFAEELDIAAFSSSTVASSGPQSLNVLDHFDTENRFYGWQFGLRQEACWDHWFFNLRTMIAFGVNDRNIRIHGNRTIAGPNGVTATPDGLLAMYTNSGSHSDWHFDVVPELGLNFGCELSPGFRVYVGYTFLYWMNAVRPGDQIDRVINVSQAGGGTLVGLPRPLVPFMDDDFWLQGISLGVEVNW